MVGGTGWVRGAGTMGTWAARETHGHPPGVVLWRPPKDPMTTDSGQPPREEPRADEIDLVSQLIGHRLRQDDIRRMLLKLSARDREAFTDELARVLRKTSALLEVSR